jgi:hypothetical protein
MPSSSLASPFNLESAVFLKIVELTSLLWPEAIVGVELVFFLFTAPSRKGFPIRAEMQSSHGPITMLEKDVSLTNPRHRFLFIPTNACCTRRTLIRCSTQGGKCYLSLGPAHLVFGLL